MNENIFWKILDMLDWSKEGNDSEVLAPAIKYLSEQSDEDIFAFENIMSKHLYDIDSRELAKELYGTEKYFSGDDFLYKRCVAIINGKGYYEAILNRSKQLDYDLEFESILYLPIKAWAKKHGELTDEYPHSPEPSYETCSNSALWEK